MLPPNHLDVFMHYYVSTEIHPRFHSQAVQEALSFFVTNEMLDYDDNGVAGIGYSLTEKGLFWLNAVLSVPLPVTSYRIPLSTDGSSS